jgi:capping protein beta
VVNPHLQQTQEMHSKTQALADLWQRLSPRELSSNIKGIQSITGEFSDSLNTHVPIQINDKHGRAFIESIYNKHGNSHRSPWTNDYYPPIKDGYDPIEKLRNLEIATNTIFAHYAHL